jgi:hypothetical protein
MDAGNRSIRAAGRPTHRAIGERQMERFTGPKFTKCRAYKPEDNESKKRSWRLKTRYLPHFGDKQAAKAARRLSA